MNTNRGRSALAVLATAAAMATAAGCGGSDATTSVEPPPVATSFEQVATLPGDYRFVDFTDDRGFVALVGTRVDRFDALGSLMWSESVSAESAYEIGGLVLGDDVLIANQGVLQRLGPDGRIEASTQTTGWVSVARGRIYEVLRIEGTDRKTVRLLDTVDLSVVREIEINDTRDQFEVPQTVERQGLVVSCDCEFESSTATIRVFDADLEQLGEVEIDGTELDELAVTETRVFAVYDDLRFHQYDDNDGLVSETVLEGYRHIFDLVALEDGSVLVGGEPEINADIYQTTIFDVGDELSERWSGATYYQSGRGLQGLVFAEDGAHSVENGNREFYFPEQQRYDERGWDSDPAFIAEEPIDEETGRFFVYGYDGGEIGQSIVGSEVLRRSAGFAVKDDQIDVYRYVLAE